MREEDHQLRHSLIKAPGTYLYAVHRVYGTLGKERNECEGINEEVQYMEEDEIDYENREKTRKNKVNFKNKKNKAIRNEHIYMMRNYDLAMAY